MPLSTLIIDLDDTLYPASSHLWALMRNRIFLFVAYRLYKSWPEAQKLSMDLFRTYGTTMRGLQKVYQIDESEYLRFVHDVPLWNFIHPNARLRSFLESIPLRKVIFTNADEAHARRVLRTLNLEGLFEQVIDIRAMAPYCKPMPEAFAILLERLGAAAKDCLMVDDSPPNLAAARRLGISTVWVTSDGQPGLADARISEISGLEALLPELTRPEGAIR